MANKASFTAEEWATLLKSPAMAGLIVVAASPSGPIGAVQESFALGKLISETKQQGAANELVSAVVADLVTAGGRRTGQSMELFGKSVAEIKAAALGTVRQAGTIVATKAPADAEAFKRWLLSISQRVAEAAKEGGFFGFGGTLVSEQEQAAIKETSGALGLA
jgi:hypothetical protein